MCGADIYNITASFLLFFLYPFIFYDFCCLFSLHKWRWNNE